MKIPFHRPCIREEEINGVIETLRSGWLTMGPKTIEFEEKFREYIGSGHAIAVSSCTAAMHLALEAAGLHRGDEVIIPTFTFTATGEVVCYFGAKPVLIDVEADTCCLDVSKIEESLTPRTRAIIPVHYGGHPCDMERILDISRKHDLHVIEDAAHSLPAWLSGRKVGTLGDATCFSFYATKTLTTGEGGMVATNNDKWAERIRFMRLHGINADAWKRYSDQGSWFYEVTEAGYKYNMTDVNAAMGLAQLERLEWMWQRREELAKRYDRAFKDMDEIIAPTTRSAAVSAWHLYVIRLNLETLTIDRGRFIEELKGRGIGTSVHFVPLHRHPFYRNNFGVNPKDFPVAELIYESIVSLPIYPDLTVEQADYVIENVIEIVRKARR
jgi:perosamine synthetase